jgi:RecA/RadA recombinase
MAKQKDLTELFVSSINQCRPRKTGSGTFEFVMSDEDIFGDVKYVLLTGNDSFDTFTGGFPFGRITEVFGLENCGKSALMIRSMCRFQAKHIYEVVEKKGFIYTLKRIDPKNIRLIKAYIDNEGSLERGFKIGIHDVTFDEQGNEKVEEVMMEKTGIGLCDTIEQVFQSVDKFLKIIEQAERQNEEDETDEVIFGIFIVDTVAGTSSKDEIERDWGDRDFPRAAAQISEGFRRLRAEISRHNVAMICTNQVRTKFSQQTQGGYRARFNTPQDTDFSTYGGKALAFYSTHRVFMFQVPIKYTLVKGTQFPAGFLIGFRTIKNRLRKPMREGRMVLLFDEEQGGLHNTLSLLETLCFLKVAELGEDGSVRFLFRKYGIETTTFAENIKPGEEPTASRSRRKVPDPEIDGRYQWLGFYKAHRPDIEKLWQKAVERANATEGLDEFYKPEPGEEGVDADPEPAPRRTGRRQPVAQLHDEEPV